MKILYVHGYLGSGNGNASRLLREALTARGIDFTLDAPEFPVTAPEEMAARLRDALHHDHYDYLVASSLGAFYTMQIGGPVKILINPAVPDDLLKIRENAPEDNPLLTDAFLDALRRLQDHFLNENLDWEFRAESHFIFGNRDTIAGNEAFYEKYYCKAQFYHVDMEHRLSAAGAEKVCDIIRNKLEPQRLLFERAIAYAAKAHQGAYRKGTTIPFIVHPLEVAAITATLTDDREMLAAAVLHDTLEDTDTTEEYLQENFGERLLNLVKWDSEEKHKELPPEATWKMRKEATIESLKNAVYVPEIILADKLSNLRAICRDYEEEGDRLWDRFNEKDPAQQLWYYGAFIDLLKIYDYSAAYREYVQLYERLKKKVAKE